MVREITVHATYGSSTKILSAQRGIILAEISKVFRIDEEDIELYEIDKKNRRRIGVEGLKDVIKVEVKKRSVPNGQRTSINSLRTMEPQHLDANQPSTIKTPQITELCKKLMEDQACSCLERAFLVNMLQEHEGLSLKRKQPPDQIRPEMKNRKVQVEASSLISQRSTSTQTSELTITPKIDTPSTSKELVIQSKRLAAGEKVDPIKVSDLMAKGYDERRNFIMLKRPVVSFVKEKYPLLFSISEVKNELDRIFYNGKCKEFIANVEKYAPFVLDMARIDDPLLVTTQEKMKAFKTPHQKKYAQEVGSILMLSSLMNEERSYLKLLDQPVQTSSLPYIEVLAKQKEVFFDQHLFRIYAENQLLCEAADFKEAILGLVASYFIFNIEYQTDDFSTLVIFEKLYLEANDTNENEVDDEIKQTVRTIQLKATTMGSV